MAKIAICIDDWKLDIFTKTLNAAEFMFTTHPGVTDDTLTLSVETSEVERLTIVINTAQERAALEKHKRGMN